tara:strand:+ start:434 stop:649 length:216 start_codon:yes stop_codon:yes gene_type:complete
MGKIIISLGLCIVILGIFIHFLGDKLGWLGNLYGDIKIIKSSYSIYIPITTMVVVSIALTLALNLFSKLFK